MTHAKCRPDDKAADNNQEQLCPFLQQKPLHKFGAGQVEDIGYEQAILEDCEQAQTGVV